jgi:hypothetical protein
MTIDISTALEDFRRAIGLQERIQRPLHVMALSSAALLAVTDFQWTIALGAVLQIVILVETLTLIVPINRRLMSGTVEDHNKDGRLDLARWAPGTAYGPFSRSAPQYLS